MTHSSDIFRSISFKLPGICLTKFLENHFVHNIVPHINLAKQTKFGYKSTVWRGKHWKRLQRNIFVYSPSFTSTQMTNSKLHSREDALVLPALPSVVVVGDVVVGDVVVGDIVIGDVEVSTPSPLSSSDELSQALVCSMVDDLILQKKILTVQNFKENQNLSIWLSTLRAFVVFRILWW